MDSYSSASSDKIDPSTGVTKGQTGPGGRPPKGGGQGSTSGASSSSNILSNLVSVGAISSASGTTNGSTLLSIGQ